MPFAKAHPEASDPSTHDVETALKHSEAFYHSLVETLPHNIFRKDLNGRFTFVNSRFSETIGVKIENILGKTDFDFFTDGEDQESKPVEAARKAFESAGIRIFAGFAQVVELGGGGHAYPIYRG
jgi:PAS domain-containing protein